MKARVIGKPVSNEIAKKLREDKQIVIVPVIQPEALKEELSQAVIKMWSPEPPIKQKRAKKGKSLKSWQKTKFYE